MSSLPDMEGLKLLLSSHGMICFAFLQNQHKQTKSVHCKQVQSFQGRSQQLLCRCEIKKVHMLFFQEVVLYTI